MGSPLGPWASLEVHGLHFRSLLFRSMVSTLGPWASFEVHGLHLRSMVSTWTMVMSPRDSNQDKVCVGPSDQPKPELNQRTPVGTISKAQEVATLSPAQPNR
uniref:Uncharacterized protein n=1 Tax=Columba livia TaxID=8932 RepID=R7VVU1_COLLI